MFTQQAGIIHSTRSVEDAARIVNDIVEKRAEGLICCAPFTIRGKKFDSLLASLYPFENMASGDVLSQFGKLDIGITMADGAISQTGSLIEVSTSDDERLLSSISRIHIAVVESSKILENLSDFAPIIRSLLTDSNTKPNISLIGGPSRTSDIELKSVLGVHGPHEVHAIILSE